jgi:hypothetical protein
MGRTSSERQQGDTCSPTTVESRDVVYDGPGLSVAF